MSRIVPPAVSSPVSDWRGGLPELTGEIAMVREVHVTDARSLFALLTTDEVARFISSPPLSVSGFERFITAMRQRRREGRCACFAVHPTGCELAVGVIQVRQVAPNFEIAEWGFAIGSPFWGSGLFPDAAALVLDFTFRTLGVQRLEARAAVVNARGNRALHKLGATCEGILRRSFRKNGHTLDQNLWSLLEGDFVARFGGDSRFED